MWKNKNKTDNNIIYTMKKLAFISSLLLLAMNSCSNEDIFNKELPNNYEKRISVVAEDLVPADGTRTSYTGNGNGYSFAWTEGDVLGIFPDEGYQTAFPINSESVGSNTALFDGGKWALKADARYAAYYPFIESLSFSKTAIPIDYTGQVQKGNGSTTHLGKYDFMATTFNTVDKKGNVNFQLKHMGCLVRFELTMPKADTYSSVEVKSSNVPFIAKGNINLTESEPSIISTATSNTVTIELEDIATTGDNQNIVVTAMFAPVDLSDSELSVSVIGQKGFYTTMLQGKNLQSGTAYPPDPEIPYVTFSAEAAQTLTMSSAVETLEYSVNGRGWTTLGTTSVTFGGSNGNLRLRGKISTGTAIDSKNYSKIQFGNTTNVLCSGDIRTLVDYENYSTADCSNAKFCYLFYDSKVLTTAPDLPATILAEECYHSMFCGCTALTTAPELPATTLSDYCYRSMFFGCKSLTNAPQLPAATLAKECYRGLFYSCNKINEITMLATDISATDCLSNWVSGVASSGTFYKNANATWTVSGASGIPVGWEIMDCEGTFDDSNIPYITFTAESEQTLIMSSAVETLEYSVNGGAWTALGTTTVTFGDSNGDLRMRGKSSIGTAIDNSNYSKIQFGNDTRVQCSGDIRTLVDYKNYTTVDCSNARFCRLFYGCRVLTSAPELPATTLASSCYSSMFYGCRALTSAPELPATTLASNCYSSMFYGCYFLKTAPELPAATLVQGCYANMFFNCDELNCITMLATDISATNCLTDWVSGVASSGTFFKNADANWEATGANGIPEGWKIKDYEGTFDDSNIPYITFTAESEQTLTMSQLIIESLEYSVNGGAWSTLGSKTVIFGGTNGNLRLRGKSSIGTAELVRGGLTYLVPSIIVFGNNTKVQCTGDIRTLVDFKNYSTADCRNARFGRLFENCSQLTIAPELPVTTLADYCYESMFDHCSSLVTAPELPATSLADFCYVTMFAYCTSLTNIPELSAASLAHGCYQYMFRGCSSLIAAPTLPATSLAPECYRGLCSDCESLTTAPELPATTLAAECYTEMFSDCLSLTTAPELPATALAKGCYEDMFVSCLSLTTAPKLPATTLSERCYAGMFYGCSKLNNITMLATDISETDCLNDWMSGVATSGTFYKNVNATWNVTGASGIPRGWTVQTVTE